VFDKKKRVQREEPTQHDMWFKMFRCMTKRGMNKRYSKNARYVKRATRKKTRNLSPQGTGAVLADRRTASSRGGKVPDRALLTRSMGGETRETRLVLSGTVHRELKTQILLWGYVAHKSKKGKKSQGKRSSQRT